MNNFKLEINLLPLGAWDNDLSKTLTKKDWDTLRNVCYEKANHRCQICGAETDDLDAHEVWDFNITNKTQTLKNIIGICTKCHGVIHYKNSVRLGYGNEAKMHFIKVNNCSEMEFASHLHKAISDFEERNKVYRWKIVADLSNFGGEGIELKTRNVPMIINPYENIELSKLNQSDKRKLFEISRCQDLVGPPKIISIDVNNFQGIITIDSLFTDKIEWFLDNIKIKTKYNVVGEFKTKISVADLMGHFLSFKLTNKNGYLKSKDFELLEYGK